MDIYFSLCIFTQYYFMCGIAQIIMIWVKRCFIYRLKIWVLICDVPLKVATFVLISWLDYSS